MSDLDLRAELQKLRSMHTADISQNTMNALIIGPKGIGKSTLFTTCRKPVLIDSFDPGGTKHLKPEIEKGEIIVDSRWEQDQVDKLNSFEAWEIEFHRRRRSNFFDAIGTYGLDSLSNWLKALYRHIALKGRFASDGILERRGWAILSNVLRDAVKLMTNLPCDFLMTGHVTHDKDEVGGKMVNILAAPPSLQVDIPLLFDEYYTMVVDPKDDKKRVLITANTSRDVAGTRLGRGKFDLYEKPDIKYLLKKAGLPFEDKPLLM